MIPIFQRPGVRFETPSGAPNKLAAEAFVVFLRRRAHCFTAQVDFTRERVWVWVETLSYDQLKYWVTEFERERAGER